jgi:hypothetical protein
VVFVQPGRKPFASQHILHDWGSRGDSLAEAAPSQQGVCHTGFSDDAASPVGNVTAARCALAPHARSVAHSQVGSGVRNAERTPSQGRAAPAGVSRRAGAVGNVRTATGTGAAIACRVRGQGNGGVASLAEATPAVGRRLHAVLGWIAARCVLLDGSKKISTKRQNRCVTVEL